MLVKDYGQNGQIKFRAELPEKAYAPSWVELTDEQMAAVELLIGQASEQEKYADYPLKLKSGKLTLGKKNQLRTQVRSVLKKPGAFLKAMQQDEVQVEVQAESVPVPEMMAAGESVPVEVELDLEPTDDPKKGISERRLKAIKKELAKAGLSIA